MSSLIKEIQEMLESMLEEKLNSSKTEDEAQKIVAEYENMDITGVYQETINNMANKTFSYFKETMYEEAIRYRADENEFIARQEQIWYKAFVASEALYIMSFECGIKYKDYVSNLSEEILKAKKWTFFALQNIHGRALQIYLEIVTLIKNGFADGAYSRWRSLYELAIIASFILKNGENTARCFYNASNTYDRYDWAKACDGLAKIKRHLTFKDIEKLCDINTEAWKQEYILANQTIHASPQGTFNRLGTQGNDNVILVGRSDYGITVPGEHAAILLAQISTMLFTLFPEDDTLVQTKVIIKWVGFVRETYFKTHDEAFPDDEKLCSEKFDNLN